MAWVVTWCIWSAPCRICQTCGVGRRVLAGQGARVDTTTAGRRLVFGIFAALAEFERELIRERTVAELKAVRARGRKGGRSSHSRRRKCGWRRRRMASRDTSVAELFRELGIGRVTLHRYVDPGDILREHGRRVLEK